MDQERFQIKCTSCKRIRLITIAALDGETGDSSIGATAKNEIAKGQCVSCDKGLNAAIIRVNNYQHIVRVDNQGFLETIH